MNQKLEKRIRKESDSNKARILQRFFKTGVGDYGEGDIFIGINVPILRKISIEFKDLIINEIQELLDSKIHEKRLIALLILIENFKSGNEEEKKQIFKIYLNNTKNINNWDLVDISSPKIIGEYLINKDRNLLYQLANSKNLWEKRIAIVSTYTFIRKNDFNDTLKISKILIRDDHDLIHKAVGWMLREVGKRNIKVLEEFLKENYKIMPRTMLRYAIEKFEEEKRKAYLTFKI